MLVLLLGLASTLQWEMNGLMDDWEEAAAMGANIVSTIVDPKGDALSGDVLELHGAANGTTDSPYLRFRWVFADTYEASLSYDIQINSDDDSANGYGSNGVDVYIQDSSAFHYTGDGASWEWQKVGDVDWHLSPDRTEMEMQLKGSLMKGLTTGPVYFFGYSAFYSGSVVEFHDRIPDDGRASVLVATFHDDCAGTPCKNGGVCLDDVNSFHCACPAGYGSFDCSTPNACHAVPTDAAGTYEALPITAHGAAATIICSPGHSGAGVARSCHLGVWNTSAVPSCTRGALADPPTNVMASTEHGSGVLSFIPATTSLTVLHYQATLRPTGEVVEVDESPFVLPGLEFGVEYTYEVAAVTEGGAGVPTVGTFALTPSVPDAPVGVSAQGQHERALVEFSPSPVDVGEVTTGYRVTVIPGDITVEASASPVTVEGLDNGVRYTITVAAINSLGTGESSEAIVVTPSTTVPNAPGELSSTSTNGKVEISFTPPPYTGGMAIELFILTVMRDGGVVATIVGNSSPLQATGLENGVVYLFYVTAVNSVGSGHMSPPFEAAPQPTAPQPPSIMSLVPHLHGVMLTIQQSDDDGGRPVLGYSIISQPDDVVHTVDSSPALVSSLRPGVPYTFRAKAINAVGPSVYSEPSAAATPYTTAGPPLDVKGETLGGGVIRVAFMPPLDNGGKPIEEYVVTAMNVDGDAVKSVVTMSSPVTVTGLPRGGTFFFVVRARTIAGEGAASAPSPSLMTQDPPVVCGDGVVDFEEECDDGNTEVGDGCTVCKVDAGYSCSGAPSVCSKDADVSMSVPDQSEAQEQQQGSILGNLLMEIIFILIGICMFCVMVILCVVFCKKDHHHEHDEETTEPFTPGRSQRNYPKSPLSFLSSPDFFSNSHTSLGARLSRHRRSNSFEPLDSQDGDDYYDTTHYEYDSEEYEDEGVGPSRGQARLRAASAPQQPSPQSSPWEAVGAPVIFATNVEA